MQQSYNNSTNYVERLYVGGNYQDWIALKGLINKENNQVQQQELYASDDGWGAVFLAKYSNNGDILSVKNIAPGVLNLKGFAVDRAGNTYFTGQNNDNILIGSDSVKAPNQYGFYIAKYNNEGEPLWARGLGGVEGLCVGKAITIDKEENIYVAGTVSTVYFAGGPARVTFGSQELAFTFLESFIVKYNNDGDLLWASKIPDTNEINSITTTHSGDIVATGTQWLEVQPAPGGKKATRLPHIFVVKLNSAGDIIWKTVLKGFATWLDTTNSRYHVSPESKSYGVAVTTTNTVSIVGSIYGFYRIGNDTIHTLTIRTSDNQPVISRDMAILHYSIDGSIQSLKNYRGGLAYNEGKAICADSSGGSFAIGNMSGGTILHFDHLADDTLFNQQLKRKISGINVEMENVAYNTHGHIYILFSSFGQAIFDKDTIRQSTRKRVSYIVKLSTDSKSATIETQKNNSFPYEITITGRSVQFYSSSGIGMSSVRIQDILGKDIYQANYSYPINDINFTTDDLPAGVYFVIVNMNNHPVVSKIHIQ